MNELKAHFKGKDFADWMERLVKAGVEVSIQYSKEYGIFYPSVRSAPDFRPGI